MSKNKRGLGTPEEIAKREVHKVIKSPITGTPAKKKSKLNLRETARSSATKVSELNRLARIERRILRSKISS